MFHYNQEEKYMYFLADIKVKIILRLFVNVQQAKKVLRLKKKNSDIRVEILEILSQIFYNLYTKCMKRCSLKFENRGFKL